MSQRPHICFLAGSAADWGGASRVLYTTLRQIDLTRIEPLVLLSGEGPIKTELESRGIRCIVWGPATEPEQKLTYIKTLLRTLWLFRQERITALHVNHRFWRPAEVMAALLLRIPVLVHFHVANHQEGSFMAYCRAAICVSHYVATESVPKSLRKEIIYNPLQLTRFETGKSMRREWHISPDAVVTAFIGQIRNIKGVQDFIQMAKSISDHHTQFIIAGECRNPQKFQGSYSEQDLIDMIGKDERIRYVGYIKDVENVYHTADIIVAPSRWQEPLGLINLEAGACSKPVVATRVGGIPEVIQDGVNGYLVEPGDIQGLITRVSQLINDASKRQRMGDAGRRLVEEKFTNLPIREFENILLHYAKN